MRRSLPPAWFRHHECGIRFRQAAAPAPVTVAPASTVVTYPSALIGGAANDGGLCTEGVSCDTVGVVVAAGNYTGKNLRVAIDWLVPANDFDEYMFLGGLGGPAV